MKRNNKLSIAIGIMLIAIVLIISLILLAVDLVKSFEVPTYFTTPSESVNTEIKTPLETQNLLPTPASASENNQSVEASPIIEPTTTIEPTKPPYALTENPLAIANITIETKRKTLTYDVMPDVEEETLKHDLGHLPTSSIPGQEGLCVIMGHRDMQFSILKYCDVGDHITIQAGDAFFVYSVYDIEIVKSDNVLQFDAVSGSNLALVTCYPFRYTGHAPQEIIVYAKLLEKITFIFRTPGVTNGYGSMG